MQAIHQRAKARRFLACVLTSRKKIDKNRVSTAKYLSSITNKLGIKKLKPFDFGRFATCMDVGYVSSISITTPPVNTFYELEKTLASRIKMLKDIGEDNDVIFSPLPIFNNDKITFPHYLFFHKLFKKEEMERKGINDVWISEQHSAFFPLLQSTRNSVYPFNANLCEDYSRYCYFFGYLNNPDPVTNAYDNMENDHTEWLGGGADLNTCFYFNSEKSRSNWQTVNSWRVSFPSSIQEILAMTALEASINCLLKDKNISLTQKYGYDAEWYDQDKELYFNGMDILVRNYIKHSLIMDKDPKLIFPKANLRKINCRLLRHLESRAENKGYFEITEKMVADGLLKSVPVSRYWNPFMKKMTKHFDGMSIPSDYRSIIRTDFAYKNGTNTLRKLTQSMSYGEMIQTTWENLYSGKRWVS
jgi:hypothetical protein